MTVQYRKITGYFAQRTPAGVTPLEGAVQFKPVPPRGDMVVYPESREVLHPPVVECELVDGHIKTATGEDPQLYVTVGAGEDKPWSYTAHFDLELGGQRLKFPDQKLSVELGSTPIDMAALVPIQEVNPRQLTESVIRSIVAEYLGELGGELPGGTDPKPGTSYDPPSGALAPATLPTSVEDGQRFVDDTYFSRPSSATDLFAWRADGVTGAPATTEETHNGAHTVLLERPGDDSRLTDNATAINRGDTINASVWVKAHAGQKARFRLHITSIGRASNTQLGKNAPWLTVTDGDWIKVAISATVPDDADGVQVRAAQADAPVYVSDGSLWMSAGRPGSPYTLDGLHTRAGETYTIPGGANPREVVFSPDGTQLSVVERSARRVSVHHLSEPWDITTAQPWESRGFTYPSALEFGHGHAIRPDGRRMYVFNRTEIWQWDLTTPWVPATATNGKIMDLTDTINRGHDICLSPDGTVLLVDDRGLGEIHSYQLTTAWDVMTAQHTASRPVARNREMRGLDVSPDGTRLVQLDPVAGELWQYELSTPWDVMSMRWVQTRGMSIAGTDPRAVVWDGASGGSFYVTDASSGVVTRMWAVAPD